MNYNNKLDIDIYNQEIKIFEQNNSKYFFKIQLLEWNSERIIENVEGEVISGTRTEDGNSIIRNTLSLNFVPTKGNYQLLNPNNQIYPNKKIKVLEGISNSMTNNEIKWYPKGVYVLTSPSILFSTDSHTISINANDKMCLCDGSVAGKIDFSTRVDAEYNVNNIKISLIKEASIEFNKIMDKTIFTQSALEDSKAYIILKLREYLYYVAGKDNTQENVILTLINNIDTIELSTDIYTLKGYSQSFSKISNSSTFKKLKIKDIIKYVMTEYAYENPGKIIITDIPDKVKTPVYIYNEDKTIKTIGFKVIDYIYPDELIVSAGTPVTTILDSCVEALGGNFEYFYDYNGNFIFQEKKNYINNDIVDINFLEPSNYKYIYDKFPIHYDFSQSKIISSYNNASNSSWANIKNDISVWGNDEEKTIGYRLIIDDLPQVPNYVIDYVSKNTIMNWREYVIHKYQVGINNNFVGKNLGTDIINENYRLTVDNPVICITPDDEKIPYYYMKYDKINNTWTKLMIENETKAFEKPKYFVELSTLWFNDRFYANGRPQNKGVYNYNLDLISGDADFNKWRISSMGIRAESITDTDIKQLYPTKIDEILVYVDEEDLKYTNKPESAIKLSNYDEFRAYAPAGNIYKDAYSTVKRALYNATYYNEQISLTCLPILTLSANARCYAFNIEAQVDGFYMTQQIVENFETRTMNINLVKNLPTDLSRNTRDKWYIVTEDKYSKHIITQDIRDIVHELSK